MPAAARAAASVLVAVEQQLEQLLVGGVRPAEFEAMTTAAGASPAAQQGSMPSSTSIAPKKLTRAIISVASDLGPEPGTHHQAVEARPRQLGHRRERGPAPVGARQVGDDLGVVDVDADDPGAAALEAPAHGGADARRRARDGDGAPCGWRSGDLGRDVVVHGGPL